MKPNVPVILLFWALFSGHPAARAATAGAWETFSSQANADGWGVYDYSDGMIYYPEWDNAVAGDEHVYLEHVDDNALWFYTGLGENAGNGAFLGNYAVKQIEAIEAEIFIENLSRFQSVDCAIVTGTTEETFQYYFCESYQNVDFSSPGWKVVTFRMDDQWYHVNAQNVLVPVDMTPAILSGVTELGFRFFPVEDLEQPLVSALDNVKLVPRVAPVPLDLTQTPAGLQITFTPGEGLYCDLEKATPSLGAGWESVPDWTGLTGTTPLAYTAPFSGNSGFYRVLSGAFYTPIVTPP